jgi:hypothetical protein
MLFVLVGATSILLMTNFGIVWESKIWHTRPENLTFLGGGGVYGVNICFT